MTTPVYGQIKEGMKVRATNGDYLGSVVQVTAKGFVIEKGTFFPHDYEVSFESVGNVTDDGIYLTHSTDDLRRIDFTETGIPVEDQIQSSEGTDGMSLREELEKEFREHPLNPPFKR